MADGNVVTICGAELPKPGKPNKVALKAAKELLEAVKSGEVVGFAAVRLHADRAASWESSGYLGGYSVLGASIMMQRRLRQVCDGE